MLIATYWGFFAYWVGLLAEYNITEVCLYFNGHLMRANRSIKMDSSKFNGFGSTIPPLIEGEINLTVNSEIINQIKKTKPVPTFHIELSDEFSCINLLPDTSAKHVMGMLNDKTNRAIIINSVHGFYDMMVNSHKLSYLLIEKLINGVFVIILHRQSKCNDIVIDKLKDYGAIILNEITKAALLMKVSLLLAYVV